MSNIRQILNAFNENKLPCEEAADALAQACLPPGVDIGNPGVAYYHSLAKQGFHAALVLLQSQKGLVVTPQRIVEVFTQPEVLQDFLKETQDKVVTTFFDAFKIPETTDVDLKKLKSALGGVLGHLVCAEKEEACAA